MANIVPETCWADWNY